MTEMLREGWNASAVAMGRSADASDPDRGFDYLPGLIIEANGVKE